MAGYNRAANYIGTAASTVILPKTFCPNYNNWYTDELRDGQYEAKGNSTTCCWPLHALINNYPGLWHRHLNFAASQTSAGNTHGEFETHAHTERDRTSLYYTKKINITAVQVTEAFGNSHLFLSFSWASVKSQLIRIILRSLPQNPTYRQRNILIIPVTSLCCRYYSN